MTIWSAEIKEIERLYDSIKGQSPELEKELERLINASDENMVLVYARRCLEVIITDLCESELKRPRKTEPLQGIIDKLNREEKIPSHIFASIQSLNSLATFGAHPKEFDPRQVKPVLNNLATIIEWYLKYKAEKAEQEKKEKVGEHQDYRTARIDGELAGIAGSGEDTDGRTAGTYGRSAHLDGSQPSIKEPAHFK